MELKLLNKGYMPARPWKRALALIIDIVVLDFFVFSGFGSAVRGIVSYDSMLSSPEIRLRVILIGFIMLFFAYIYFSSLEYLLGQTIGKYILDIYVVDKSSARLPLGKALLRNICLIPVFPFYFLIFIDAAYFLIKSKRVSDAFAGTEVVEKVHY